MRRPWLFTLLAAVLAISGVVALSSTQAEAQQSPRSAIYGGGPFYQDGQAVMNTLRASGFTTVILWSIHVHGNGDLYYNDILIVQNGRYVGDAGWPARLRTLKQAPTSVNRIEVSIGAWGVRDWETIAALISSGGTGPSSILYRNFQALKAATGADAINNDDESFYQVSPTAAFARMAAGLGYSKFTFAPYTNQSFWVNLKNNLGGAMVDRLYLQGYAGGTGNNPATWRQALGMTVDPGLWSRHGSGCSAGDSPATVESKMRSWRGSAGIVGGFMWLYDDMKACASQGNAAAYARAIRNGTS
ncbi:lysyl endopeptidase [Lentzea sp. NPDC051213]|uniref:lysyl endopeptidase n=1 Tax=Lentzea sp. NPDC051213 TaxID=3364126 RepID=UPI003796A570